jgi:hypothetical protein
MVYLDHPQEVKQHVVSADQGGPDGGPGRDPPQRQKYENGKQAKKETVHLSSELSQWE